MCNFVLRRWGEWKRVHNIVWTYLNERHCDGGIQISCWLRHAELKLKGSSFCCFFSPPFIQFPAIHSIRIGSFSANMLYLQISFITCDQKGILIYNECFCFDLCTVHVSDLWLINFTLTVLKFIAHVCLYVCVRLYNLGDNTVHTLYIILAL